MFLLYTKVQSWFCFVCFFAFPVLCWKGFFLRCLVYLYFLSFLLFPPVLLSLMFASPKSVPQFFFFPFVLFPVFLLTPLVLLTFGFMFVWTSFFSQILGLFLPGLISCLFSFFFLYCMSLLCSLNLYVCIRGPLPELILDKYIIMQIITSPGQY